MYPCQSPPHKKESNVERFSFEILLESISTFLPELALFCRKLFPSTSQDTGCPREDVDAELSASTADAVLEFSVLTLASAFFASAPRHACSATQSCLLDVSVRQCFLVFELFSCEDQSLLILTSKLHHFFTRASWAATVILSTITLFLITSRIECVTTFAQAFQRSDQTARCALHRTFRVAG